MSMLVFVSIATTRDQATLPSHLQAAIASCNVSVFSFAPSTTLSICLRESLENRLDPVPPLLETLQWLPITE